MEINPNFAQFEEPTAARLREQFVDFLATIPAPSEMSDEQLASVGEVITQTWMDIAAANELITAEEIKRGMASPDDGVEESN